MKFIAHRGYKKNSLENSIQAFKNAIKDDYFSGFELDIRTSKNGDFMVIHDPFIDRVTTKSGLVKDKTTKQLLDLGIPKLESVLKLKTDKIILIEIKDYDINLAKLVKLLNKYRNLNIYVDSFSAKVINKLVSFKKYFKIGILNMVINTQKNYDNYDFICLYKGILTNDLVNYFLTKNKEVFVWGLLDNINIDKSIVKRDQLYLIVNKKL